MGERSPTATEVTACGLAYFGPDSPWSRNYPGDIQETRVYRGCSLTAGANRVDLVSKPPPWSASRPWVTAVDGLAGGVHVPIAAGDAGTIPLARDAAERAVDEYLATLEGRLMRIGPLRTANERTGDALAEAELVARQSARLRARLEAVTRYARRLREEGLVDADGMPMEPATRSGR